MMVESEKKRVAVSWPRTFRALVDQQRGRVVPAKFRNAGAKTARDYDEQEAREDAESELKSVIWALESVGEVGDDREAEVDFDDLRTAQKALDEVLVLIGDIPNLDQRQKAVLDKADSELMKLRSEFGNEYKEWDREKSRHRIKIYGLTDDVKGLVKKLKGVKL